MGWEKKAKKAVKKAGKQVKKGVQDFASATADMAQMAGPQGIGKEIGLPKALRNPVGYMTDRMVPDFPDPVVMAEAPRMSDAAMMINRRRRRGGRSSTILTGAQGLGTTGQGKTYLGA